LPHTFEAIHNKDYSVVKTSKAGAIALVFFAAVLSITALQMKLTVDDWLMLEIPHHSVRGMVRCQPCNF
jgi:hypothetical protein